MKRVYHIFAVIFALASIACSNDDPVNNPSGPVDIPVDTGKGYIHFDTGVSTRGKLITDDYLTDNFAVYGYYYSSTWQAAVSMAKPNVFDAWPEIVSYADGIYSYVDPVQWKGYNYAFYAYYPAEHTSIVPVVDENTQGEPYITYNLPSSSNDPTQFIDLMTASYVDTNANASKIVPLQFHHRLSAIDVGARCFYDYTYEEDGVMKSIPAIIEVDQLILTFDNLINNSAKIYLNKDKGAEYTPADEASQKRAFAFLDGATHNDNVDIAPNADGDTEIRLITRSEDNTTLIVIPQSANLVASVSMQYYIRIPDDAPEAFAGKYVQADGTVADTRPESTKFPGDVNPERGTFTFDRPLLEGRRYFLQFNFTSDAVSVNIVAADEWDEDINGNGIKDDNIDYEFE